MSTDDDDLRDVLAAASYYVGRPQPARPADTRPPFHSAPVGEASYHAWVLQAADTGSRAAELRRFGRSLRQRAADQGITQLIRGDRGWPAQTGIHALPCLWVRGDPDVAARLARAVTITGARASTEEGRYLSAELAGPISTQGLTIVTGLSRGIDAAAAAVAFDAAITPPVLVSPAGLDHPTRPALKNLADRAMARSALISPFPPSCEPSDSRWIFRDTLLGTLGAATVLIEASATSQTLRAARAAHAAGRLVLAVPGSVAAGTWAGCHQLIANGVAQLVTSASAVLNALRVAADRGNPAAAAAVAGLDGPDTRGSTMRPAHQDPQPACENGA